MISDEVKYTVTLIGDTNTGKTSILNRYLDDPLDAEHNPTIVANCTQKKIMIDSTEVVLSIFDTAGQNQYRFTLPFYYHKSDGLLLVFDLTNEDSFNNLADWKNDIENNASANLPILLLGNKCDLTDKIVISKDQINEYLKTYENTEHSISYYETSAFNGQNIKDVFQKIAFEVSSEKAKPENATFDISGGDKPDENCC